MKTQTTPTKHSQPITANQAAPVQQAPPRQHAKQKKKPPSPKQQKPRVCFLCEKLEFLFSDLPRCISMHTVPVSCSWFMCNTFEVISMKKRSAIRGEHISPFHLHPLTGCKSTPTDSQLLTCDCSVCLASECIMVC